MAESTIEKKEKVKPIRLVDNETGESYILEFNLDTVRWAEDRGFDPEMVTKFPMTVGTEFFYYAFRMHQGNKVSREKTDKIFFDMLGGINETTGKIIARLLDLYYECYSTFSDEDIENPRMAVEM
jgi:hypothetical protein